MSTNWASAAHPTKSCNRCLVNDATSAARGTRTTCILHTDRTSTAASWRSRVGAIDASRTRHVKHYATSGHTYWIFLRLGYQFRALSARAGSMKMTLINGRWAMHTRSSRAAASPASATLRARYIAFLTFRCCTSSWIESLMVHGLEGCVRCPRVRRRCYFPLGERESRSASRYAWRASTLRSKSSMRGYHTFPPISSDLDTF